MREKQICDAGNRLTHNLKIITKTLVITIILSNFAI